jgi:hypothetical protein
MAGMTIEMVDGSAKKLLDDTVPRDRSRHLLTRAPEPFRERAIGGESIDRHGDRRWFRFTHEPIRAVSYEFERTAGISGRDHGFGREECFECDVSIIFIERRVDDAERAGVQICHGITPQRPCKGDTVRDPEQCDLLFEQRTL